MSSPSRGRTKTSTPLADHPQKCSATRSQPRGHEASQRAGAVRGVEPLPRDEPPRRLGDHQADPAPASRARRSLRSRSRSTSILVQCGGLKDDLVDPVKTPAGSGCAGTQHHAARILLDLAGAVTPASRNPIRVRGHDQHGIAEVNRTTVKSVSRPSSSTCQQRFEHFHMGSLDLSARSPSKACAVPLGEFGRLPHIRFTRVEHRPARLTVCRSWYSLRSNATMFSSCRTRQPQDSWRARSSHDGGPRKMNEPIVRRGSLDTGSSRMIASATN